MKRLQLALTLVGTALGSACGSATPAPALEPERSAAPPAEPWRPRPMPPRARLDPSGDSSSAEAHFDQRLSNGIRLVVVPMRGRARVTTRLYLGSGSADDAPDARGATYIAAALLGETHGRFAPGRRISEESLRRKVFDAGAMYRFEVGHDETFLEIGGFSADLPRHLRFLRDAVDDPRRNDLIFSAYRGALIHAVEELAPEDDQTFVELISRAAFGQGHPYARSTIGDLASLRELGFGQITDRQDQLLVPSRATLLVVGPVTPMTVLRVAESALGTWRVRRRAPPRRTIVPPSPPRRTTAVQVPIPAASLVTVCGARPLGDLDVDESRMKLLAGVLGSGFGSRLHRALRTERGLVYSASAQLVTRRRAAALIVCSAMPKDKSDVGLRVLRETIAQMGTRPPERSEIERAQAQLATSLATRTEDPAHALATWNDLIVRGRAFERAAPERLQTSELAPVQSLAARIADVQRWRFILAGSVSQSRSAAKANGLSLRRFDGGR